jgi:hypothetical protein
MKAAIGMKKQKAAIRYTVFFLLCCVAVVQPDGVYSNENRALFRHARSTALAQSDRIVLRDGSPQSNPAAFAFDSIRDVSLSYMGYYANTFSSSVLSFSSGIDARSGYGGSLSYWLVPDILIMPEEILESGKVPSKSEREYANASETMGYVGYGTKITFRDAIDLAGGIALHGFRERLIDVVGYGIGLDAGVLASFRTIDLSAGLLLENATTTFIYWNRNYKEYALPHLLLGVAWQKTLPYIYGDMHISYSTPDLLGNEGINHLEKSQLDSTEVPEKITVRRFGHFLLYGNLGIEYVILKRVALRFGFHDFPQLSFGAGIHLFNRRFTLDLSYAPHDLSGSYFITARYRW